MQQIDDSAREILRVLSEAGERACLVGGCVRDLLLGRPVHDWDISTSARPERVQALFAKTIPTGIRHGTVTVLLRGTPFEVTTFRSDGSYSDGRRPDHVCYVSQLGEDLARRDFTINAMAMDADGTLTDLFGGREDLRLRRIRCVGEARQRFEEDALRMLRALRFSAQLGFSVEEQTARAIRDCAPLCARLSRERIRDEMEKTLLSPRPETLAQMIAWGLLQSVGLSRCGDLGALGAVAPERLTRWAQAKHMLPELDLSLLRLEKHAVRVCTEAAALCGQMDTRLDCKRAIARCGWESAGLAAALCGKEGLLQEIAASGECVTRAQLAVRGSDLEGCAGAAVSQALERLLQHVLEKPQDNTRERLLALLREKC